MSPAFDVSDDILETASAGRARSKRVLLLTAHVYGAHGGIPSYMQRLVEILSSRFAEQRGSFSYVTMRTGAELNGEEGAAESMKRPGKMCKLAYCYDALKAAWQLRPHIVIAGELGLAPVAWALYSVGLAKSYAIILHGTEAWRRISVQHRFVSKRAHVIVATTKFTAAEFASHNDVRSDRVSVLPLGLKESELSGDTPAVTSKSGPLRLLTVGRLSALEKYKGVDTLISAVALGRRSGLEMTLTVVGGGSDQRRLRDFCERLAVSDCVYFLGSVSEQRLQQCYRDCDVFAMPSKGEGFGIVFLEAMRCGKPCIGGDHGGTPEVITDGHDGYVVRFGDVETTLSRLALLAREPELRRQMGENARQTVASRYLFPNLRERWVAFVENTVAGARTTIDS